MGAAFLAAALLLGACDGRGSHSSAGASDRAEASEEAPAGVHEFGPDRYEAVVYAYEGEYQPSEIRIPVGAEVTFRASARDLPHGFLIEGTDVELDLFSGRFDEGTYTFDEPGEYRFICHVYCGPAHDMMSGVVVVE